MWIRFVNVVGLFVIWCCLREKGHNGEEAIGVEEEPCYGTEVGGKK